MTNPTAAILIIGNEILSGRTKDSNINFLSQNLNKLGIKVGEARIIPDKSDQIIDTVRHLSRNYTYVFTTGGIGATHDDITADCVARAFNRKLEPHPEAIRILTDQYGERLNDVRLRMALIPEGGTLIKNSVSKAPGFQIENVFCLAGIPSVMNAMFESLIGRLNRGAPIFQKTITCSLTENTIADELGSIQKEFPDVEIGSYPFFHTNGNFGISLVLRSINSELLEKSFEKVMALVKNYVDRVEIE